MPHDRRLAAGADDRVPLVDPLRVDDRRAGQDIGPGRRPIAHAPVDAVVEGVLRDVLQLLGTASEGEHAPRLRNRPRLPVPEAVVQVPLVVDHAVVEVVEEGEDAAGVLLGQRTVGERVVEVDLRPGLGNLRDPNPHRGLGGVPAVLDPIAKGVRAVPFRVDPQIAAVHVDLPRSDQRRAVEDHRDGIVGRRDAAGIVDLDLEGERIAVAIPVAIAITVSIPVAVSVSVSVPIAIPIAVPIAVSVSIPDGRFGVATLAVRHRRVGLGFIHPVQIDAGSRDALEASNALLTRLTGAAFGSRCALEISTTTRDEEPQGQARDEKRAAPHDHEDTEAAAA